MCRVVNASVIQNVVTLHKMLHCNCLCFLVLNQNSNIRALNEEKYSLTCTRLINNYGYFFLKKAPSKQVLKTNCPEDIQDDRQG